MNEFYMISLWTKYIHINAAKHRYTEYVCLVTNGTGYNLNDFTPLFIKKTTNAKFKIKPKGKKANNLLILNLNLSSRNPNADWHRMPILLKEIISVKQIGIKNFHMVRIK